ncbi:hypothetical protein, partial [Serratia marcescens]|uniref:hypothetical protein n=1 Tax=Serratia marcescens TaxID=615 RepID=UPI001BD37E43
HQRLEDGVAAAVKRLLAEQPGSLLLFLPGVAEINRVLERLTGEVASDTDLCPLYGALHHRGLTDALRRQPRQTVAYVVTRHAFQ